MSSQLCLCIAHLKCLLCTTGLFRIEELLHSLTTHPEEQGFIYKPRLQARYHLIPIYELSCIWDYEASVRVSRLVYSVVNRLNHRHIVITRAGLLGKRKLSSKWKSDSDLREKTQINDIRHHSLCKHINSIMFF